jgi:nucleotide-binding universal stress UspA family protein
MEGDMAIKDLAVAYNGSPNADAALDLAAQMCGKYDAALTGIFVSRPVEFEGRVERWITADVMETLRRAQKETTAGVEASFRDHLAANGFAGPVEWLALDGQPNAALARQARYHDILLLGQFSDPTDAGRPVRAEDLVLRAGKPLIIVPNNYVVQPFAEYAVVGWDGSRPAARALSDAMQILETKARIDVVCVTGSEEDRGPRSAPKIIRHLERHGVDARPIVLKASREGVGATILGYCEENAPDVLVMGAYNHAKLREDLFGGVTRHILQNLTVPVMMAH